MSASHRGPIKTVTYSEGFTGRAPPSGDTHLDGMLATEVIVEPGSLCRRVDGLAIGLAPDRRSRYEQCCRKDKSATGHESTRVRSELRPRLHRYPPLPRVRTRHHTGAGRVRQWLRRGPGGQGLGRASTPPARALEYPSLLAGGTRGGGHECS